MRNKLPKYILSILFLLSSAVSSQVFFEDDFDITAALDTNKWTTYWIDGGDSISHGADDSYTAGKYCRIKCGNTHVQLRSKATGDYTDLTVRFWMRVNGKNRDIVGTTFAPCDNNGKTPLTIKTFVKGDGTYRVILVSGASEEVLYESLLLGRWEKWEFRVKISNGGNNLNCWLLHNDEYLRNNTAYAPMSGMLTDKLNQFIAWGDNAEIGVDDVHIINNAGGTEIFSDNFEGSLNVIGARPNSLAWKCEWMDPEDEISIQMDSFTQLNNYAELICADSSIQLRSKAGSSGSRNIAAEFRANIVDDTPNGQNIGAVVSLIGDAGKYPLSLYFKGNGNGTYDVQIGSGNPLSFVTVSQGILCNKWIKWQIAVDLNQDGSEGRYTLTKDGVIVKTMEQFVSFTQPDNGLLKQIMFWGDCRHWFVDDIVLNDDTSGLNLIYQPQEIESAEYTLSMTSDGGMLINAGEDTFNVFSMMPSYYTPKWLGDGIADNWSNFNISSNANTHVVSFSDINYNFNRTITKHPAYIQVRDTFTNFNSLRIGLAFTNEIRKADADTSNSYLDGVITSVPYTGDRPEMPYVQVAGTGNSLGMIAADDVYRNQIRTYSQTGGKYGLADDYFALGGNSSYTIEWHLYPVKGKSHYNFINQVRNVWQTDKLTIKGLYAFLYSWRTYAGKRLDQMSSIEMSNWLSKLDADYLMFVLTSELDPRPEYPIEAFGDEYYSAVSAKRWWRPVIDRIRSIRPDIKIFPYYHAGINVLRTDLASCALKDENGVHKSFTNYLGYTRYHYCPLANNSFGALTTDVLKKMIGEFGTDGIYIDEFTFGYRPIYMNGFPQWDGFTALQNVNGNGRSTQQRTTAELIWRDKRQALVDLIDESNGEFVVNFQPVTKEMTKYMALHNAPAFIECNQKSARQTTAPRGHIFSPLLLCGIDINSNSGLMEEYCDALNNGTLPALIHDGAFIPTEINPAGYFFPITIKNIYSGVIVGSERIITTKGGVFGFGNEETPIIYLFDTNALQIPCTSEVMEIDGSKYVKINVSEGQIAVIKNPLWNFNYDTDINSDGIVDSMDLRKIGENWLSK